MTKNFNIQFLLSICQNNDQERIVQAKRERFIVPKKQHRECEPAVVFGMSFFGYDASRFSMVIRIKI